MLFIDVIDGEKTKTINIPTDWEDMTLNYWCGIYKIIDKYKKKKELNKNIVEEERKENLDIYTQAMKESNLDFLEERDLTNMNKEIFKYIGQVSDKDIERVDMSEALKVLSAVTLLQEEYKPKNVDSFEFEGDTYFFPKDNMSGNTFEDYIESTQIEMNIKSMTHGHYDVLPEQMAILCRKFGEGYDEEKIKERTEKFRELKMDTVLEFSFFLTKQSQRLARVLEMYSEEKEGEVAL